MRAWTYPYTLALLISVINSALPAGAAQQAAGSTLLNSVLESDRRLEKPISVRYVRVPLARVVNDLAQSAGVSMKTARSISGEPTLVVVTDQPVRDVMRELAVLFHYQWRRSGEVGDFTYELVQDVEALREEEALRGSAVDAAGAALRAQLDRRAMWARRSRSAVLAEIEMLEAALERVNDLPALRRRAFEESAQYQALQRNAEQLPMLREMADPLPRILVRLVSGLSPAQWNALSRGEVLEFSTRPRGETLPLPGARARELRSMEPPAHKSTAGLSDVGSQAFRSDWKSAEAFNVALRVERIKEHRQAISTLRIVPVAVLMGEDGERRVEATHVVITGTVKRDREVAGGLEGMKAKELDRPHRRLALDELEDHSDGWRSQVLASIADTYGVDVIADAYRLHTDGGRSEQPAAEISLKQALQRYVTPYALCGTSGEIIRVRRRQWFDDRLADLPEEEVVQWAGFLRGRTSLSLEETAALARAIRREQWPELLARLQDYGIRITGMEALIEHATPLRLFAALSPIQKEFVRSGGWLSSLSMPPSARSYTHSVLREWRHTNWVSGILRTSRIAVLTVAGAEPWLEHEPTKVTITLQHDGQTAEHTLSLPRVVVVP